MTPLATYGTFDRIVALSEGYYLTAHAATQNLSVIQVDQATKVASVHSTSPLPSTAAINSIEIVDDGSSFLASVSSDRARSYPIDKSTLLIGTGGSQKEADLSSAPGPPTKPLFSIRMGNYFIVLFGSSPGPRNIMSFKSNDSYHKSFSYNSPGEPVDM